MNNENFRDLQLVELDILKEVVRICENNKIEYFLDSGTALGALRHQGFIPWDDDIDIGMTRDNYNRFLEAAPKEMSNEYFLQTRFTDNNSPYYFAKVRKDNTVFMEWNKRNIDMHQGIYIDIFPYDNLPNNYQERVKFQNKCDKLYRFHIIRSTPDRDVMPQKTVKWFVLAAIRRLVHYISKIIPFSLLVKLIDISFTKYNDEDTDYLTCLAYGKPYTFKKSDMFPLKEIIFESEKFKIANNIDSYLKELYGEYMKLPPENERTGHLPYKLKL